MGGAELEVVAHVAALARMRTANCDPVETERPEAPEPAGRQLCRELSPAEIDVLLWISRGYSDYSEIGKLLHRSPLTVETEVRNMRAKLGLHSRTELMGWLKRVNSPDFAYLGGGVFASGLKSEPTDAAEPTAAP
jgi:DNA-binding CsgD family transcriptional regulator